uniref:RCC1 domain-containing protein RUG3, mitochondrial isoform X2 n=1 Tax=Erigeron canadensis TaxID=72917 RepID=UPI001CB8B1BC|nr:RCC1 domain-containing protein RUG3, mitochondrial isoform X2 [Erigeron canadensis]
MLLLVDYILLRLIRLVMFSHVYRGYGGFGALGHSVYTRELSPKRVEGNWEGKIAQIATSGTHTAAITEAGQLYIWGRDEGEGRLGLGPGRGPNEVGGLSIPSKVKVLPVPVISVACGGFFTTVIADDGQLWSWGANSNNELGRGNRVGGWKPQPIPGLESVRIVQITSGGYHSLALTDEGRVLSWGYGGHGQLGHFSTQNQPVPLVIESLASEKVVHIACGGSSSAAVTDDGKLYMWGNAKDGQLGVPGVPEIQPFPIEVKFLNDDDVLGSHKVLSVAVGASHALCLVSR